jgi:hypothetical protein
MISKILNITLSCGFLVACSPSADPTGASDTALTTAPASSNNDPGEIAFTCAPTRDFVFRAMTIRVSPISGSLSYAVTDPTGSTSEGATTQIDVVDGVPAPRHSVSFSAFDGPPNTRTTGLRFIDVVATGTFVRAGSFRTPAAALEDGKVTVSLLEDESGYRLEGFTGLGGEINTNVPDGVVLCTRR